MVKAFAQRTAATVIPFSRLLRFNPGACVLDGYLMFNGRRIICVDEIRIKGVHNLENALAAAALSLCAGADLGSVAAVLREFPGLEHRLEFVRKKDGVTYINDSKGTNVGAVVKSVEGFTQPGHPDRRRARQGERLQPAVRSFQTKGEAPDPDRQGRGQDGKGARQRRPRRCSPHTLQEAVRVAAERAGRGGRGAPVAGLRELRHVQGFRGPGQAVQGSGEGAVGKGMEHGAEYGDARMTQGGQHARCVSKRSMSMQKVMHHKGHYDAPLLAPSWRSSSSAS